MQVTPVWVGNDGTYIELNSVRGRKKDRNLRSNGKVSLLFTEPEEPVSLDVRGRQGGRHHRRGRQGARAACDQSIDSLALALREPDAVPVPRSEGEVRVLYKVEPTQILTFGNP